MINILKLIIKKVRKFDKNRSRTVCSTLNEIYNTLFKDVEKIIIKKHFKTVCSNVKS